MEIFGLHWTAALGYLVVLLTFLAVLMAISFTIVEGPSYILGALGSLIIGTIIAMILFNSHTKELITNREKVENQGFNFLYKGIKKDTNEICAYALKDGLTPDEMFVLYCEPMGETES